jgi:hypothetical protein
VSVVVYNSDRILALPFCSTGLRVDSEEDEEFFFLQKFGVCPILTIRALDPTAGVKTVDMAMLVGPLICQDS